MVIKSLTITSEAYDALKSLKHGNESFSEVIIKMSKEKIGLSAKYFGSFKLKKEDVILWKNKIIKNRSIIEKEFNYKKKNVGEKFK